MLRRGPGLVRTVGRTAVIAGTASAVGGRVSRHQQQKYDQQDQAQYEQQAPPPPAPAPAPAGGDDIVAKLQELSNLKDSGVLSEAEFEAAKAKLLA